MNAPTPGQRALAQNERDHVSKILADIEGVKEARLRVRAEGQTEAGEHLALVALSEAEEELLTLILDPGFGEFLGCLLHQLSKIAGEAA